MGEKDNMELEYFSNSSRFADIWNFYMFGGKSVIKSEDLQDADSVIVYKTAEKKRQKRIPDKIKLWKGKCLRILIQEYQSSVDYGMVQRNMLTEAVAYNKQRQKMRMVHRKKKDLTKSEFNSGINKNDRFIPVVTLVINLSLKEWDAPRCLYETFEEPVDEIIQKYVTNYRLNVFDYHDYDDFDKFETELRKVFKILKCANNREEVDDLLNEDESFKRIDDDTADMIEVLTKIKISYDDEKGEYRDMCKAWEEQKEYGISIGLEQGIEQGIKQGREAMRKEMDMVLEEKNREIAALKRQLADQMSTLS